MTDVLEVQQALRRVDAAIGRSVSSEGDPRGAFARATGLAMAGVRATVSLTAAELAGCIDLVVQAAERSLPLVVRVACADGHDSLHSAADRGCAVLCARDLQEAVDLALVARRTAERALLPVLVACDLDETSVHDVVLPSEPVRRRAVGAADDDIGTPTAEQRMLFGDRRRRLPRWFDLERPALLGAVTDGTLRAISRAARGPYALAAVPAAIEEAFAEVARATGRPMGRLAEHRVADARIVVVGIGYFALVAEAVADHLRDHGKLAVGAIGVRTLRPFPAADLIERLRGKREVVVVDRADGWLADDPPFARELGAAMQRALENGRVGRRAHRDLSVWREKDAPLLHVALVGPGSRTACSSDLAAFCREVAKGDGRTAVRLGVDFAPAHSELPKRQVLLDRLRRDHAGIGVLGLRAAERADVRPDRALTADVPARDLPAAARILHAMIGGAVRSAVESGRARLTVGAGVRTVGCNAPVDVVVSPCRSVHGIGDQLARGASVVLACREGEAATLPARLLRERFVSVHRAPAEWPDARLGAMVAALTERHGDLDPRRALAEFEKLCGGDAARVAAFRAALERTRAEAAGGDPCDSAVGVDEARSTPKLLLPLTRTSEDHDSLARFRDQVGVLHDTGALEELVPDPYLAVGTVPPLSASFGRPGLGRATLPAFDASKCTGCGACWTACPDGSIGALVIGARALLEAGIDRAKQAGHPADALRMLVGKIAAKVRAPAAPASAALQAAYDDVVAKAPPSADRRSALDEAFAAVRDAVGALPLAAMKDPASGSDALLALAIDPDSCKACGLCAAVCEPEAMTMAPRERESIAATREVFRLWEDLPDTPGDTIGKLTGGTEPGLAAALSLSRHVLLPLSGGDDAEAGSGARLAVRLVLGAVEVHGQPLVRKRIDEYGALQEEFAQRIRDTLAQALPTGDLDALAGGLEALGRHDLELSKLAGRVAEVCESGRVDGARLDRLVGVARSLVDRRFGLERGAQGLGRARAGIAIVPDESTLWACRFPKNPFAVPAVAAESSGAGLAAGLVEGQVDAWLDEVRLARRARLELDRPTEAVHATDRLRALGWADLSAEERAMCPPLVLIGSARALTGTASGHVEALLRTDLPVLVVALAEGDLAAPCEPGLLALADRDAFVVQSSVATPDHLVRGVMKALRSGRPALLHVHAPSPIRDGIAPDRTIEHARAAISCRAFPSFVYDPGAAGVFGTRLDLAGNPDAEAPTPPEFVAGAERHRAVWRTLRELAGIDTPFTERVRAEAEHDVASRHAAEVAAVRQEADARLAALRDGVENDLADRLRDKLVALATRGRR